MGKSTENQRRGAIRRQAWASGGKSWNDWCARNIQGNIHLGDVIIAIDGEPVTNEDSMLSLLENRQRAMW